MFQNKVRINYRLITMNTVLFLLITYFVFHSLSGERGVFAYFRLKKLLHGQTEILQELTQEKSKLETTIKYLHPNSLNYDFLDELARQELGLVAPEEKTIYLPPSNPAPSDD